MTLNYTRTEVTRIPSRLGDVILQRDTVKAGGEIERRDIVMFTPTIKAEEDDICISQ